MLIPAALFVLAGFAQNMNVQSAAVSLKEGDLAAAKDFIDKAAANEQTANNYKMWYYRAQIFYAIDTSKTYRSIDPSASEKSVISYINCIKTDTKGWYTDECKDYVVRSSSNLYNHAVDLYVKKDYEAAIKCFNILFDVFPYDTQNNLKRSNITVDILNQNIYMSNLGLKNNQEAEKYINKLIAVNFNNPKIYEDLALIKLDAKDTINALDVLEKALVKFPENAQLLNRQLNIYIAQNKLDILIKKFTDAIELNPDNELYYYNRANIYSSLKQFGDAEKDYLKAIEIKEDYFDANYNLGSMIFNQGVALINAANDILDDKKYQAAKLAAETKMKQALPYLERCMEINPKDFNTLVALKALYVRFNDKDKLAKVTSALDGLKK